jgi:GTPase SAR1 family protein
MSLNALDILIIILINMNEMQHVKIVIVGDGSIGKTCIMVRY